MGTQSSQPQTPPGAQQPSAHLYYGGSINPSGKLGPKPLRSSRTFRSAKRLETIVRLENAAISEAAAAAMLSISVNRLRLIKKTPEYLRARIKITHGIITDNDGELANIRAQRREAICELLPPALRAIADAVITPAHTLAQRKFQLSAAQDILDREGTFPRVSRSEVAAKTSGFDWGAAEAHANVILNVLNVQSPTKSAEDLLGVAASFSGGAVLSPDEQHKAIQSLESLKSVEHE